ncbi:hypothetical protein GPA27_06475 [Aromatoleum toluolicum]|uniref:Uncharacterized protein n=1 Tax=Aromatoleum toluolicum TaxID=90060 RepID=A0ABX1NCT2_9RHOO|nr:hypothetical protein [Aromatoleum toluolicum]NMF97028.1 hypothetical protein [Aromatoleum toluolicum]
MRFNEKEICTRSDFATQMQRENHSLVKEALKELQNGKSLEELSSKYGFDRALKAQELQKQSTPTRQQVLMRHQRRTREVNAEFGKELWQAGMAVHQHSVEDFKHVLITALDLVKASECVSASAALTQAFPDSDGKAKSIGNSRHHRRITEALISTEIMEHPALATFVSRSMREYRRCTRVKCFRDALGFVLEGVRIHNRIATLEASNARKDKTITELEARISILEAQIGAPRMTDTVDDVEPYTIKARVLALRDLGYKPQQIATTLKVEYERVKSIIRRGKQN